jgi:hypothetical protein
MRIRREEKGRSVGQAYRFPLWEDGMVRIKVRSSKCRVVFIAHWLVYAAIGRCLDRKQWMYARTSLECK